MPCGFLLSRHPVGWLDRDPSFLVHGLLSSPHVPKFLSTYLKLVRTVVTDVRHCAYAPMACGTELPFTQSARHFPICLAAWALDVPDRMRTFFSEVTRRVSSRTTVEKAFSTASSESSCLHRKFEILRAERCQGDAFRSALVVNGKLEVLRNARCYVFSAAPVLGDLHRDFISFTVDSESIARFSVAVVSSGFSASMLRWSCFYQRRHTIHMTGWRSLRPDRTCNSFCFSWWYIWWWNRRWYAPRSRSSS
jgi:hypothetical protein